MPFVHIPQPNVHDWKPDYDSFDQAEDRIVVYLGLRDESVVCAWSSDGLSIGGLIIAPEAIPDNLRSYYGDALNPHEYARGKFVQPQLFVRQMDTGCLSVELAHPKLYGVFETSGIVRSIYGTRRGSLPHSLEVAGRGRGGITGRSMYSD